MATVNLTAPTDYAAQLQDIERRRQMAQALQTQGMSPIEPNPTAGGYVIPTSWTQGLAKALQTGLGAYQQQNLAKEQSGLSDQYRQGMKADLLKYQTDSAGTPEMPGDPLKATQDAMLSQYEPVQKVAGANYANLLNQQNFKQEMAAITGSMNPHAALLTGKEPIANGAQLPGQTGFGGDPAKIAQDIMASEMPDADKQAALAQLKEQQGVQTPAINPFLMSSNPRIQAIGTMQQKLADNKDLKQMVIDAAGNRQDKSIAAANLRAGINADGTPSGDTEIVAQGIAKGQIAPMSSFGMRSPGGQRIMARVMEINPDFNGGAYQRNISGEKAFTEGKQGQTIKSFNVALSHLDTLSQLTDALGNGDLRAINKLSQAVAEQTGQPAPTNFDAAKQIIAKEVVKAIVANGGGEGERQAAEEGMARSSSPQQLKGVIGTYQQLFGGQLEGLRTEYNSIPNHGDFNRFLNQKSQATDVPSFKSEAEAQAAGLKPGTKIIINGQSGTWH